ncbi:AHH domain-containing protein [uncultured Roseibium sp.]|uniref:AHH domain-containing protein n=1 Tax=uncultured Roseibium sp. TaxID=1936171 RepID=UPI00261227AA|nr:AHH domain-containing protein [uncultured Roseibium sp.]
MTVDINDFVFASEFRTDPSFPKKNPKETSPADWNANFEGHHLIPTNVANKFKFLKALAQIDLDPNNPTGTGLYKHNSFNENGIWLPTHEADSIASGLALHKGGHTNTYNGLVEDLLREIERKHNLGNLSQNTDFDDPDIRSRLEAAAKELDAVEKYLRDGLMANRVSGANGSDPDRMAPKFMINSADPHAQAIGGFDAGYPASVAEDYKDFLDLHFTNGDPVDGTPKGSYQSISTASDPSITNANGDVVNPFERRALIDPSFDTAGIEVFSAQSQLIRGSNSLNDSGPQNPFSDKVDLLGVAILTTAGIVLVSSDPAAAQEINDDIRAFLESVDSDTLLDFGASAILEKVVAGTIFVAAGKQAGAFAYITYEIGININDARAVLEYFEAKFPHWTWVDYVKPLFDYLYVATQYFPDFEFDFPEFVMLEDVGHFSGKDDRQAILALGDDSIDAGGGNDWIAHTGTGVVRGGEGDDTIVAFTQYEGIEQRVDDRRR